VRSLAGVGLCHRFGGLTALHDVDLHVGATEVVGVIGPNGSGKTTLVDALTGHLRPQQGRIELGGADVTGRGAACLARAGLARTFQNARLMEPLSVRDNVRLGLHTAGLRGRDRRACVDDMLGRLGLLEVAASPVAELSHGQRRRVELGRAMVSAPTVLVLDEPTSGLFGPGAAEVAALIAAAAREGAAVLMIEHDLGVVAEVCTRVAVLEGGVVVAHGPTRAVLAGAAVAALRGELGRDRLEAASA
jgi:branched-chain amino acid transport system ATP-binding protein